MLTYWEKNLISIPLIVNNVLLLADFNSEMTDPSLKDFCKLYSLKNLIKRPNLFQKFWPS